MLRLPSAREVDAFGEIRAYRGRLVRFWIVVWAAFFLFGLLWLALGSHQRWVGIAFMAGAAWFERGAARLGVFVGPHGVEIRNPIYAPSRRFAWSEIDHFEVRRFRGYPYVAYLVSMRGEAIPALAISSPTSPRTEYPAYERRVQLEVDEMNTKLARHRTLQ